MRKINRNITIGFFVALSLLPLAFASEIKEASTTVGTTSVETKTSNATKTDIILSTSTLCKRQAVDTRENNLSVARVKYNTTVNEALEIRKKSLKESVQIVNDKEREQAKLSAYNLYKASTSEAQKAIAEDRKNAWLTYEKDMQSCTEIKKGESKEAFVQKSEERRSLLEKYIEEKKEELFKKFNIWKSDEDQEENSSNQ